MITPGPSNTYGESNYEVFDPLNWLLDGLVDMPSYNMSGLHDMEAPGIVWINIVNVSLNAHGKIDRLKSPL